MAEAALYFLAEHVKELRVAYRDVISDADKEFEELKNAIDLLKAFLKNDVPKQPNNRHLVREMERQIIEVVYEVEDTIDSCMTQAAASKSSSLTKSHGFLKRSPRPSLAKQIKLLTQDKVTPMVNKAKSDFSDIKPAHHPDHSITSKIIRADLVVGLKDTEDIIINHLCEKSEEVEVISIIGMSGLGKTTLAYKIFGDLRVHNEFPTRIWIHASRGFDRKAIFLSILKHFTDVQQLQLQSDEELVSRIRECLENVRFLLVFDNVWSVEDWNILKGELPRRNGRGKVVITSSVGRNAGKSHTLRFLSPEESWELLPIEVFGRQDDTVQGLEDVGRRIAEK